MISTINHAQNRVPHLRDGVMIANVDLRKTARVPHPSQFYRDGWDVYRQMLQELLLPLSLSRF
jgi:hypothetical protein